MIDLEDLTALVAEVERLRASLRATRRVRDTLRLRLTRLSAILLRADDLATEAERAAVVAWLRDCALDPETTGAEMRLFQNQALTIERGEHRREGAE